VFALPDVPEITIGRKDPQEGIYPDVDLTPLDPERAVAARHAKIVMRGPRLNLYFLMRQIGVFGNDTFVNNQPVVDLPAEFRNGDLLRFGPRIALRFSVDNS